MEGDHVGALAPPASPVESEETESHGSSEGGGCYRGGGTGPGRGCSSDDRTRTGLGDTVCRRGYGHSFSGLIRKKDGCPRRRSTDSRMKDPDPVGSPTKDRHTTQATGIRRAHTRPNMRIQFGLAVMAAVTFEQTQGLLAGVPLRCAMELQRQRRACQGLEQDDLQNFDAQQYMISAEALTDEQVETCCEATARVDESGCFCEEGVIDFMFEQGMTELQVRDTFIIPSLPKPYGCDMPIKANWERNGQCDTVLATEDFLANYFPEFAAPVPAPDSMDDNEGLDIVEELLE